MVSKNRKLFVAHLYGFWSSKKHGFWPKQHTEGTNGPYPLMKESSMLARMPMQRRFQLSPLSVFVANKNWYGASLGGPQCYIHNPTLGFSHGTCLHTKSDDNQTRPQHTTQTHNKHSHHGGGAASPSSCVDLMNQRRLRSKCPCTCFFHGHY